MIKIFLIGGLLLCSQLVIAQTDTWLISGYVRGETGETLPGALLQVADTVGVTTDSAGFFQLRTRFQPKEITVRYIGYFPRRMPLQSIDFQDKTLQKDLILSSQNNLLETVTISAKRVEVLAEEDFLTDIYDYDFVGNNLLLLLRERKKYFARLLSPSGGVVSELQLAGQPTVLHRSCTGSFHAVGPFFAQEITLDGQKLDTFSRYSLQRYYKFIEPCVLEAAGNYFFRVRGPFNQSVYYLYFDTERKRHLLAEIHDKAGEQQAQQVYADFLEGKPLFFTHGKSASINEGFGLPGKLDNDDPLTPSDFSFQALARFASSYEEFGQLTLLELVRTDSVYAPLFKFGDDLILFDHTNGRLSRFGMPFDGMQTTFIYYQDEKGWQKELLKDDVTQELYAHFAPGGKHLLRKLNPRTGKILQEYAVPEVNYISENFKIRNGCLYYLGRPNNNVPNRSLFKIDTHRQTD